MRHWYRKTKEAFKDISNIKFAFRRGIYQKDSFNRIKHDFSNVLICALLNQRRDEKKEAPWNISIYEDTMPIDIPKFKETLNKLSNMIKSYDRPETYYGIIEFVVQRTEVGYEIFDVSFR